MGLFFLHRVGEAVGLEGAGGAKRGNRFTQSGTQLHQTLVEGTWIVLLLLLLLLLILLLLLHLFLLLAY